jgi:acetyl esterase/lipase
MTTKPLNARSKKSNRIRWFWQSAVVILLLVVATGCSLMKPVDVLNFFTPSGSYHANSFAFGNNPRQQLDLYLPDQQTIDKPLVVFVYGGAWKMGNRGEYTFVAQAFTRLGYPVMIADYRLYPEVTYPAFVDDIANAIAYIEHNTDVTGYTPTHGMILAGHSSGAHTAALLATQTDRLTKAGVTLPLVGFIGLAGPYDLPLDDEEVIPIFPNVTDQEVNPVLSVTSSMPKSLIIHGAKDDRVLPKHSKRFAKALEEHNVPVTLELPKDMDHVKVVATIGAPLRFLSPVYDEIKSYLNQLDKD